MHFQSSYKTLLTLSGCYSKKYHTLFYSLDQTLLTFYELVQKTTHCSRVYIKQHCHFKTVPSKLNCSKNCFPDFISQNTNTLRKLLSHNIDLFRARISNSIHTALTELLPNYSKHFLRVSMNTWTDRIHSNWKFHSKSEKVGIHTWNR